MVVSKWRDTFCIAAIVKVYKTILSFLLYPASYPTNKLYPDYPIPYHSYLGLRVE